MCNLGSIGSILAPVAGGILGSLLLPGFGTAIGMDIGAGLGGGIGAAVGSEAYGVGSGQDPVQALPGAVLSGIGGYLAGPSIGSAYSSLTGAGAEAAAGAGLDAAGTGALAATGTDAFSEAAIAAGSGGAAQAAAAGAGGAAGSSLSSLLGSKYALPVALGGMSLLNSQNQQIPYGSQLAGEAAQLTNAEVARANQGLAMSEEAWKNYQTGTIPLSVQQAIKDYQEQQTATIKGNYANMGLSGSSMEAADLSKMGQEVAALTDSATQINFQNAISALGIGGTSGSSIYGNLAQMGMTQNQNLQNTWNNLLLASAFMYGRS